MMTNRYLNKVVSLDGLIEAVREHRSAGRTLVHCHGCFDIIHPGHLRYLQFARRQGDVLLVSLTGDAGIDKSAQHPYIPQELRAENLAALEMVDLVYVDPNATAADLLGVVHPNVYVKGKEYESADDARFREERRIVEDGGGTVIFSSGDIVYSSTRLLQSLGESHQLKSQRLEWVRRRYDIHADSLAKLIADMQGKKVVVVGDLIVDRYVYCDARNVASESPMLSLTELGTERFLGGVGVVAGHLAALGADPFVLTQCGTDERSEWAVRQLQRGNIDSHLLRGAEGVAQKSRFLVEETKIVKVDEAVVSPLDSVAQRTAAAVLLEAAHGADAVIFCDFGFGMLGGSWLENALRELRRSVSVIGADVSGTRGSLLRFRDVDLMTPTERELRAAVHDYQSGLSSVAWTVMNKTRARRLLVTLDKDGLLAFDRPTQDTESPEFHARLRSEQLPALADHAVDRLGCGDALLAVATLAMASGAAFMQAAYLGSVAAALEVSRLGNRPINGSDLRRWVHAIDAELDGDTEWDSDSLRPPGGQGSVIRIPPRLDDAPKTPALAIHP